MSEKKYKPECKLIGEDGKIFNLLSIASVTLKQNGMEEESKEMYNHVYASGSYEEALMIIGDYVSIC
ncbi:MAG: hypothetical protein KIG65_01030 [Eubacteriales bacterium]|nr:hypothetical protein [Eubacteriales bacterium]